MTFHINIPISNKLYKQAQELAQQLDKDVSQVLSEHLEATLTTSVRAQDLLAERERIAYQKMHSSLLEAYENCYVAIYQGQLVDHDNDKLELIQRLDLNYPDQFVLVRQVLVDPEPELRRVSLRWAD